MINRLHLILILLSGMSYARDVERSSFDELAFEWSDFAIATTLKSFHFELSENIDSHVAFNIQWQGDWILNRSFWMGFEISYPNVVFDSDRSNHNTIIVDGWFGALFTPFTQVESIKLGVALSGQFAEVLSHDENHEGLHLLESGESEFGILYGAQIDFVNTPLSFQYLQKIHFTNPQITVSSHLSLVYFWRAW